MGKGIDLARHSEVPRDFRAEGRCLHSLSDILVSVLCGVLAGGPAGVPARLLPGHRPGGGKHLCIGGKELRGSVPAGKKHALPGCQERGKGHGRGEGRRVYVCQDLLEATQQWAKLQSVVMVETTRWVKESEQTSTRFYISSLKGKEPKAYASFIRGHRGIENKLHWHLDVGFGEDASQIKKDNGPQDMPATRKLALFIIGKDNNKMSIERKRKKAARNNQFLLNLFKNL